MKTLCVTILCVIGSNTFLLAQPLVEQTWGLCIGISEYEPEKISLNWANKDAIDFCSSFLRYGLGLPEDHYHIIKDGAATRAKILDRLAWLAGSSNTGDRVYIFYSGHGKPSSPILPHDSENSISLEEIKSYLGKIYAHDVVFFADACYSGRLAGKGAKSAVEQEDLTGLSKGVIDEIGKSRTNLVIMTSAKGIQEAYELEGQKNGIFTYYLLKALMEKGQQTIIDQDHNDELSLYEVYEYVHQTVANDSEQEPQISDIEESKNIILLRIASPEISTVVSPDVPASIHAPSVSTSEPLAPKPGNSSFQASVPSNPDVAYQWIQISTTKAMSICREIERLNAKAKAHTIAKKLGSATAEAIQQQIEEITSNIDAWLREYGDAFAELQKFDASGVDDIFVAYQNALAAEGKVEQIKINQLVHKHFQEYLLQGANVEQWKIDYENF